MVSKSPSLQVVVPMAGLGQRFRDAGVMVPKPLITVDGAPMFMKAVGSLAGFDADPLLFFIIREEDEIQNSLGRIITERVPGATVVRLASPTRGAIETVLKVSEQLDPQVPLLVLDCDIAFHSPAFTEFVNSGEYEHFDGALMYFDSVDPAYSFLETGDADLVTRVVEKQPISSKAVVGAYFFSQARIFLDVGSRLLADSESGQGRELFLSLAVNELVTTGKRIKAIPAHFENFGTPQALLHYQSRNSGQ